MATREQMANARDARPGQDQDRRESTADAAAASAATVPWGPAGIVYPHGTEWVADDDDADRWDGDDPAGLDDDAPSNPAPSLLRRAIPLLWAAALTVAALQHAGEVERRAALREPSSAELDMQDRAQREIKAAWRSVGTVAAVTERTPTVAVAEEKPVLARTEEKPTAVTPEKNPAATIVEAKPVPARVEGKPTAIVPEKKSAATAVEEKPVLARIEEKPTAIVPEKKAGTAAVEAKQMLARIDEKPVDVIVAAKSEPVLAQALSERATAEDTPSDRPKMGHALVEPITEVARATTNSGIADGRVKEAERPAIDEAAEAVAAKGSQEEAKTDVAHLRPRPSTGEAAKTDQKGRITTSRASRHRAARAEPTRAKHTRVSSSKYVAFEGHSPRYFTIERPSRMAP
jgi:hypothetical protein